MAANEQALPMVGNLYSSAGTTAWLFDKVKYYVLMLGFIRQALNRSTTELLLLIVPMSSPTIGNTNVVGRLFLSPF
jgi:hypothetical protein